MLLIVKPIIRLEDKPQGNYREFDGVKYCYTEDYPIIKIVHESGDRYVMMRVPDDCYIICQEETNNG